MIFTFTPTFIFEMSDGYPGFCIGSSVVKLAILSMHLIYLVYVNDKQKLKHRLNMIAL